jgi:hypothetical protein
LEMHQNNIFLFKKKIIFDISVSKWSENTKIYQFEAKKKNLNFFKSVFETQKQIGFYEIKLKTYKNYFTKTAL